MKKLYTLSSLLCLGFAVQAQVFWTEGFGTGCNRGQLASAYTGTNGAWTIGSTGTNDATANQFYVSATCGNTGAGNCSDNCSFTSTTNRTLHVSNIAISVPPFISAGADTGSSYFAGVSGACLTLGVCATTHRRAQSPIINCTGKSNINISFIYLENGDLANDDAQLVYSADGGTTWSMLDVLAKTTGTCTGGGQWTAFSIALPASSNNNPTVKIGFTWQNNDDQVGTDPSFAVDDINLSQGPLAIAAYSQSDLSMFSDGNGLIHVNANGLSYKTIGVYNLLGEETKFTTTENTIQLAEASTGIYIVTLEVNGVRITRKVMMN